MTLDISLTPETEAELRRRAAALGKDVAAIVREAVEEKLAIPATFAEILAPIHRATAEAGGVDEAELDALVERCRNEIVAEKESRRPG